MSRQMWGVSDESLLAGLGAGDPDAGAAFIRRFQRRVYGLAISIVGDTGLAEDVAQETFARAWRHAQAYDPRRGPVAAWLLSICRNLSIDTLRPRRAEPTDPQTIVAMQLPSSGAEPDDLAVLSEEAAVLRRAMQLLPADQLRSLVMAAYYGQTAREISESEKIPLGTAKTRIRTAMIKLRATLEREMSE
ncbi:MAG: RNA polymerase sigma factor [Actinomycetota bacterium]